MDKIADWLRSLVFLKQNLSEKVTIELNAPFPTSMTCVSR